MIEGEKMSYIPCKDRKFPLWLSYEYEEFYATYLFWLKCFLERLGNKETMEVWAQTFKNYDDTYISVNMPMRI